MKTPEEIKDIILPNEYVLEHGVDENTLYDEYYYDENGMYHYQRMFDKPMDEGGKPYTGIAWCSYGDCARMSYSVYRDGYPCGEEVIFYDSGALKSYWTDDENYGYEWYENGALKSERYLLFTDIQTNDRMIREYDKSGKLMFQRFICRKSHQKDIDVLFECDRPEQVPEVTFHDNGSIAQVKFSSQDGSGLYSKIELDGGGIISDICIDPFYMPEHLRAEGHEEQKEHYETFTYYGNFLSGKEGRYEYWGLICFGYKDGYLEKVTDLMKLIPDMAKYYSHDSTLNEEYSISGTLEYHGHIWRYENGVIRRVLLYPRDGIGGYEYEFDREGRILDKRRINK